MNIMPIEEKSTSKVMALLSHFFNRIKSMVIIEPIIGNIIAIGLAIGLLALLGHPALFPKWLVKYHHYLTYAIYTGIVIQLLLSACHSLLLPLTALTIASGGFAILQLEPEWPMVAVTMLQQFMLLGVLGMIVSVIKIR